MTRRTNTNAPLDEREIDRLESLLAGLPPNNGAMRLDEVQGLCVAMAMGPDATVADGWVDAALGLAEDESAPEELASLLERFRAQTEQAVNARALQIRPRITRTGRADYRGWCEGFLTGVELSDTDWFAIADAEELSELLFPIDVLAEALPKHERAAYGPADWRRRVIEAEAALPDTVSRLADYWAIVRNPPATLRREGPKVGRNDPCPCGSGRKFKQCHGRGA